MKAAGRAQRWPSSTPLLRVVGLGLLSLTLLTRPTLSANLTVSTTNDTVDGTTTSIAALVSNPGSDGRISLREAVLAANNTSGSDTINLPAGTYRLTAGVLTVSDTLNVNGAGMGSTTIDGNSGRIFTTGTSTVALQALRLTAARDTDNNGGGAITKGAGSLSLTDVQVDACTSQNSRGGAIVTTGGSLSISGSVFSGNQSSGAGGAIFANATAVNIASSTFSSNQTQNNLGGALNFTGTTLTISGSTFSSNRASGGNGGAVWVSASTSIAVSDSSFTSNQASNSAGAGLSTTGAATLTVTDTEFEANSCSNGGCGAHIGSTGGSSLTRVTFFNNASQNGLGGGLLVDVDNNGAGAAVTVTNGTLHANSSSSGGGALGIIKGRLALVNVTVAGNSATNGAAGIQRGGGTLTLLNTLVAANTGGAGNCSGGVTSNGYNLDSGATCGLSSTGDRSNATAGLGTFGSNGGTTRTVALTSSSAAVNNGTSSGAPTTDQRGYARIGATDIGAFEFGGAAAASLVLPLYLTSSGVPSAGLSTSAPTATTLANFDSGRDSAAGLFLQKGGSGAGETDATKYQRWLSGTNGITLSGAVQLRLWSAMKDFNTSKGGSLTAYLRQCNGSGGACTTIDTATLTRNPWSAGSGTWVERVIDFGTVSHTVPAGSTLEVKVIVDNGSDDDMLLAYATTSFPSRLAAAATYTVSGTVFEDRNYGGGAGRSLSASGGTGIGGARVELYDSSGAFVTSTTTTSGTYSFAGLAAGTYHVRVASQTVASTRTGTTGTLRGVMTFRTSTSGGVTSAVTDHVGGTNPAAADPASGAAGTTFSTGTYVFSAGLSGTAHAVAPVAVGSANVTGVDFGFNFDTVVNVNDSGQGSLRQAITNANALTGDSALAPSGRTGGIEHLVFMIGNGSSAAGLRSTINLFTGDAAVVAPRSALPDITSPLVLDARTQPGWSGRPVIELNGTDAGAASDGLRVTGGGSTVAGFAVNRFGDDGIALVGSGGSTVVGNHVGTDPAGTTARPNGHDGVSVEGSNGNTIGGLDATDRNVMSGNANNGLILAGTEARRNRVLGNYVGLDVTGDVALGNGSLGIYIDGAENLIGGTDPGAGNVIGGNQWMNLYIGTTGSATTVQGNLIGPEKTGRAGLGAGSAIGVYVQSKGNLIGGADTAARNVISGNPGDGVQFDGAEATANSLFGNLIGRDADDKSDLGNGGHGVSVFNEASGNQIGGIGKLEGNVIRGNKRHGVSIEGKGTSGNSVLSNLMAGNGGEGIDLGSDGPTGNDDASDPGPPNNGMDTPVFMQATMLGGTLTVSGFVGTGAGTPVFDGSRVEIFVADTTDGGPGEGMTYLGSLTADGKGYFSGTLGGIGGITLGVTTLTATATDPSGNTGEFSKNITVTGAQVGGTVFEDRQYGGGAGRSLGTSGGAPVVGARVELYDTAGAFLSATTTGGDGSYVFADLDVGSYHVRVASQTVASGRTGSVSTLRGVMTYRVHASGGSPVAVTDFVGGTNPALADPASGSAGTALNTSTYAFTAGLSGTAHAVSPVTVSTGSIGGIDFGFNFDTVVNTNASGQGSLRQVITNANTLGGDASLQVSGRTPNIEHVVFMIGNGSSAAGLRSTVNLFSGGVATITPGSELAVTSPLVIDAQTQPGWSTRPVVELNGTGAAAGSDGLAISSGGSTVRGFVINRWPDKGIALATAGSNTVQGNWIGLNNAGTAASANGGAGVQVASNGNTIGGTGSGQRNVISGNSGAGIQVDTGTTGTVITGNRIGTNADGTGGVGNAQEGLTLQAPATVGGIATGAGNTVAYNTGNGISVRGAVTGAAIRGNAIFANTSRGIDLGNDGVTANDGAKPTGQPNLRMDMPVTVQAVLGPATLTVTGYVGSATNQTTFGAALVDVYVSDGDSSGHGEGVTYVGTLTADASGWFTGTLPTTGIAGLTAGATQVTATATDASGNTSEFGINRTTIALAALANGGFESSAVAPGNFSSYNGGNTSITSWVIRRASIDHIGSYWPAAEGNNSIDLSGNGPGGMQQTVLTVPGQSYTLAFSMAANVNCGTVVKTMTASAAGASGTYTFSGSGRSNTAMGWQQNTLVFTATSEATTLIFDSQDNNSCGAALDYVRLLSGTLYAISGTVFEDRNYGGGAGRSLTASTGSTVNGARVELYDSAGAYVAQTSTAGSGTYSFPNLTPGSYHVRVVSSTVASTRSGTTAALRGVLTFRTTATTGTAVAVTDFVGGTLPSAVDPGTATGGTALNTGTYAYSSGLSGTAHAIAPVTIGSANVTGVDFGFNFSTVVNIGNTGQGSLRQAITNANTLGGDNTLAQSGRPTGIEHLVFMISNGTTGGGGSLNLAGGGLRTANNLTSGGVATVNVTTALPSITTAMVVNAQAQPGWVSTPVVRIDGAGAPAATNGLTLSGTGSTVRGLAVTNFYVGIALSGGGSHLIAGNHLGLDAAGNTAAGNRDSGIYAWSTTNNVIGGTAAADRNVISGNVKSGMYLHTSTSGFRVWGNRIGTNADGTAAVPNNTVNQVGFAGITLDGATSTQIGGTDPLRRNLISGNQQAGVHVSASSTGSVIAGNYIGTDVNGTAALPNALYGVLVLGATTTVGGSTAADGNLITGNGGSGSAGVRVRDVANATVRYNRIGTNASGSAALSAPVRGVELVTATNAMVRDNLVSGGSVGIFVSNGSGHRFYGNQVGTNADASGAIGHTGEAGLWLTDATRSNTIGGTGTGEPNTIAHNTAGIRLDAGAAGAPEGQNISANRIYGNSGLGIDLTTGATASPVTGVNANDGATTADRPNRWMDHPVLTSATLAGSTLTVAGHIGSAAGQTGFAGARVEVFASDNDGSGFGEGQVYLGVVTADGNGNFSDSVAVPAGVTLTAGVSRLTATATDASGNTSEFGPNQPLGQTISGTVFEDVNYGGGAGRSRASASGVGRGGVTVELIDRLGALQASTTTAADGSYAFIGLEANDFLVRVVTATVTSSRAGATASLQPVQTYRYEGSWTGAAAVTNEVGGLDPAAADSVAGGASYAWTDCGAEGSTCSFSGTRVVRYGAGTAWTIRVLTGGTACSSGVFGNPITGTAKSCQLMAAGPTSIASASVRTASLGGVDFGFNFATVVNVNDSGAGSLRQVITNANTLGGDAALAVSGRPAGVEHIVFMISNGSAAAGLRSPLDLFAGGAATVAVASALPAVTASVVIDAQTQPGWTSAPVVAIDGAGAGSTSDGLAVTAGSLTVRGLAITGFGRYGMALGGTGIHAVQGCHVGVRPDGTTAAGNGNIGIHVTASTDGTLIGGADTAQRNVISGNTLSGVGISSGGRGVQVIGNHIGTNAAGTAGIGNGQDGVRLDDSDGAGSLIQGNLISGNSQDGVTLRPGATGVTVTGNRIGTDAAGSAAVPNQRYGIEALADAATIGGSDPASPNVVSGNRGSGILVGSGTTGIVIQGNLIGVTGTGTGALGNGSHGVDIDGGSGHRIGGTASGAGNTIAHNTGRGVRLGGGNGNAILGNAIHGNGHLGIDNTGGPQGAGGVNANDGGVTAGGVNLLMDHPVLASARARGSQLTVAGHVGSAAGQAAFAGARVEVFVSDGDASGHGEGRIYLGAITADGSGNFGGSLTMAVSRLTMGMVLTATATDTAGNTSEFGPQFSGLVVDFVVNTTADDVDASPGDGDCLTAGGTCSLRAAIAELNAWPTLPTTPLVAFELPGCAAPAAAACRIAPGTALPAIGRAMVIDAQTQPGWTLGPLVELDGRGAPSFASGLAIDAAGTTVRGLVIGGFGDNGIRIAANDVVIEGNHVGLLGDGVTARANGGWGGVTTGSGGVYVASGTGAVIGGTLPSQRNVLSGNGGAGVWVNGGSATIVGNYVGTTATGLAAVSNGRWGVHVNAGSGTRIGGPASGQGNLVSGNGGAENGGIFLAGTGHVVQGNTVGMDATGASALPNGDGGSVYSSGIDVRSGTGHLIGGTGAGEDNLIAGNLGHGVRVSATSVRILGNRMQANLWLGIDLGGDGVSANDGLFAGAQANGGMDQPVLGAVGVGASGTTLAISGQVGTGSGQAAFAGSRIEVFKAAPDATGRGEGLAFVGTLTAGADGRFSGTLPVAAGLVAVGDVLTATATDADGRTSEFGPNITAVAESALAPGRFDAFDATTPAGALSGALTTRVAGVAGSVAVVALDADGTALQAAFEGSVTLQWMDARDNSGALDAGNCRSSWVAGASAGTATFTTAGAGRATLALTPAVAGREWRLRITHAGPSGTVSACSGDALAVRPASLQVTAVSDGDAATAGTARLLDNLSASGGRVHRAGRPFSLRAAAFDAGGAVSGGYDGSPALALTRCLLPATGCTAGALTAPALVASGGLLEADTLSYGEVGAIELQLTDDTFAAVDSADTPLAQRRLQSAAVGVGRFVPDSYTLALTRGGVLRTAQGACAVPGGGFTYFGQSFRWATAPQVTVTARNAAGGIAVNWTGSLMKLVAASHATDALSAAATPAVTLGSLPGSRTLADGGGGTATLDVSSDDVFALGRDATPRVSTSPVFGWTVSVADTSEAAVAGNPSPSASVTQSAVPFDQGAVFHTGRLKLNGAHGDMRVGVRALVELQKYTAAGWARLSEDNGCLSLPAAAFSYANGSGRFAGSGNLCAAPLQADVALAGGRAWMVLPKSPGNLPGALTLQLNLGSTAAPTGCTAAGVAQAASALALPHLQGAWNGATALDGDPSAVMTWGVATRAYVLRREQTN